MRIFPCIIKYSRRSTQKSGNVFSEGAKLGFCARTLPKAIHVRTCKLINWKYHQKRMPAKEDVVKAAIRGVIGTTRLGRKKVIVKVQKKHPNLGASKIRRVYQKEGFSLYKRMKKRRNDNPAIPIEVPNGSNVGWAMDFMSDSLANGSKFRTLNVIDQFNRKCLRIEISRNIPSRTVTETLQSELPSRAHLRFD